MRPEDMLLWGPCGSCYETCYETSARERERQTDRQTETQAARKLL
jgi:NAD-dependent dihydropyrimidine dehydrogenase PreA subunit